ncbi:MAG: nitroreductase family protein [Candidatus Bipolaricaulis sp.]|nr:nitroreductase family protein [Candidatus Bipolaricaulis sp.]
MELGQALAERVTVRRFAGRPVDSEIVRKAVRAALRAPAYNHLWEWAFLRVSDPAVRVRLADALEIYDVSDPVKLHALFDPLPEEARRIYLRALPVQRSMLLSAPTLLVPVYRPKRAEREAAGPADLNAHAAIWMAIAYLLLSLAEDGVGGCTLVPGATEAGKALLHVPRDWEIATLLPIGYPQGRVARNAHPQSVDAYLHDEVFRGFSGPSTLKPMG